MTPLEKLAIQTALHQMVREGYFSICTIDKILRMSNRSGSGRAYDALSLLHCVKFRDMPLELQQQLPALVKEALSGIELSFDSVFEQPARTSLIQRQVENTTTRSGLARFLGFGD